MGATTWGVMSAATAGGTVWETGGNRRLKVDAISVTTRQVVGFVTGGAIGVATDIAVDGETCSATGGAACVATGALTCSVDATGVLASGATAA